MGGGDCGHQVGDGMNIEISTILISTNCLEQTDKISVARKIDMDECSLSDHSWITERIIISNAQFARKINILVQLGNIDQHIQNKSQALLTY